MKPLMAPLACGALAAALLYGLLAAAERRIPEPEDPWLDGWVGDGMRAEFRAMSTEPEKDAMPHDTRELFRRDKPEGTMLRNYLVQNTSTQVVRMAKPGLVPEIPEGRSLEFRLRPKGNTFHVCRSGRTLVFVSMQGKWIPFVGQAKTSKSQVQEIFDSFEETVRRYP
jgi:hypothetical protein